MLLNVEFISYAVVCDTYTIKTAQQRFSDNPWSPCDPWFLFSFLG